MKRLATSLLLVALIFGAATVSAQTTFRIGVRAGINRTLTTVESDGNYTAGHLYSYATDKQALVSWQAGLAGEIRYQNFALQPALIFSQKGDKLSFREYAASTAYGVTTKTVTSTNRYNWVELPINVVYTLRGDHGLQLLAGPYVALAVGGTSKGDTSGYNSQGTQQTESFDEPVRFGADSYYRRFDMGLNFGVGYRQGPLQVQLSYAVGLLNLHQVNLATVAPSLPYYAILHQYQADAARNRVAQVTGTYFFSL